MKVVTLFSALALLATGPALADGHMKHEMQSGHGIKQGMHQAMKSVAVTGAWARASVGRNGAAFLTLTNHGKAEDRLVAAEADVSKRVELHTHIRDGNIMRMRQVDHIAVASGKTVTLKPGGLHVMFLGLTRKLKKGESFPLTLVFEKAGKMKITVPVKGIGAMKGGDAMHKGHGGHGNMKH